MNFKNKELIIFDFDGTLINSIPDLTLAINTMLTHYDLPNLTIEDVTPFIGNGARTLVERALKTGMKDEEITEDFFEEVFQFYFEAYEKVTCKDTFAYPGVAETLDYLREKDYKMVICTNKPFEFIEPILDGLQIKKNFSMWIGEDSLEKKKPDAAPLLHLARKMNINVENCVMIGDSKNDIYAAQNANMDNIGVSYGYNYNEHIADYDPTMVVDQFSELKNLF